LAARDGQSETATRYVGGSRRERIIQPSELIKIRQSKPDLSAARACLETTATSATAEIAETQPEVLAQLEDRQGATFGRAESSTQKREFQYTPLEPDSGQIRLFVLSSGTAKERLKCTLVVKDLDRMTSESGDTTSAYRRDGRQESRPQFGGFVALSYVWGDPSIREWIEVNDKRLSVTRNLYEALFFIRADPIMRPCWLWADAICINQADREERAREIKKMGIIYSKATMMYSWIGHPGRSSPYPETIQMLKAAWQWFEDVKDIPVDDITDREELQNDSLARSLMWSAALIFQAPYWNRLWITQELALPRSIRIQYGMLELSVRYLFVLKSLMEKWLHRHLIVEPPEVLKALKTVLLQNSARLFQLRSQKTAQNVFLDFPSAVRIATSSDATDPRDKVFGLLAILPAEISARIQPDYSLGLSTWDAHIMFNKACVLSDGGLNGWVRALDPVSLWQNMPSWILNLSPEKQSIGLVPSMNRHERASGSWPSSISFSACNHIMTCQGLLVDAVDLVATLYKPPTTLEDASLTSWDADIPVLGGRKRKKPGLDLDNHVAMTRVLLWDSDWTYSDRPYRPS
jgi:hypothetical protein